MARFGYWNSAFLALLAFAAGPAVAADLPVKAPPPVVAVEYNWTGIYAGVNGGWADQHMFWAYQPPIVGAPRQTNDFNWDSGVLGAHIGGQYQFGRFVVGVEAGYIWNDPNWQGFTCPNPTLVCQAKLSDIWTAGGRLGYAWDRVLVYGTGGWASANIGTQVGFTLGSGINEFSGLRHDGWFGGIGIEYAAYKGEFADLIVGAEYTHIELNREFHCVNSGGLGCRVPSAVNRDMDGHADMVRARLSVKLNPWGRPAAVVAKY